jgi:OPA family glycerol-3-phosphate transporter-like MFS transporter
MANPMNHSAEYRRRRLLNWFPLGLTYATFYMGRYNLNVASPQMMEHFSWTKAEFGMVATAGFWTYALSVAFNGPLADRIGGKKAIIIGAVGASVLNLVIGLLFLNGWQTKVLVGMSLLYAVNQYFQSFGALSVVKVNAPWFHVKERGVFGGVFGMMISSGYFLAMTVGGWILAAMAWYWVFLIPAAAMAIMAVVDLALVKDRPSDAGFANLDTGDATSKDADKDKPVDFGYLVRRVFSNRVILTIIVAEFCTGFVRQGVLLWYTPFLKEVHHIPAGVTLFSVASTGIMVGGILGGLLCGYLSDRVFGSRRPPVAFIFYIGQIVALLLLGWATSPVVAAVLIPFTCMWIFGVHGMLSATSAMDFGGTKAAATVTGICDGVQYLASGLTGFALGGMLDVYGWGAWTWMIMPFSLAGAILMTRLWNETPLKKPAAAASGASG